MRTLLSVTLAASALALPSLALAYDPRHVFITNRGGQNVVELDEHFTYVRTWFDGTAFEGLTLSGPSGMAFTPDDSLFLADYGHNRVVALDASGAFLRAFSTASMGMAVESIYFDGAGVLYATSFPGNGIVARFDQRGGMLANVVNGPAFTDLGNVNLTEAGDAVLSDYSAMHRGVREISGTTGALLRTFGTDLGRAEDMQIDGGDRIFVSHFEGNEVVVFGPAPMRRELYRFTAPASAGVVMEHPTGIAITHDCHILVGSFTTSAVFVFQHTGDTAPTFERVLRAGSEIPASARLSSIESIAVSGLGQPGGFDEFADYVPSCDEPPVPDAGPRPDAGSSTDAAVDVVDARAGSDAGRRNSGVTSGCACTAIGTRASVPQGSLLGGLVLGMLAAYRSARRRRSA